MKGNGSLSGREVALLYGSNMMGCRKGTTMVVQGLRKLPQVFSGHSAEEVAERVRAVSFSCARSANNKHRAYEISLTFAEQPEKVLRERQDALRSMGMFSLWRRAWTPVRRGAARPRVIEVLSHGACPNGPYGIVEAQPISGSVRGPLQKQSIWRVSMGGTLERVRPPRGKKRYSVQRCTLYQTEWASAAKKSPGFPEPALFEEPEWGVGI